jgi:glycerophosphoryl diester phosphodiesterase
VATYAAGIGVHQDLVLPDDAGLVDAAHDAGLAVHVWTVRDENRFLAERFRSGSDPNARGDALAQTRALLEAGVDGVFTDHPDTAVEARRRWLGRTPVGVPQDAALG